MNSFKTSNRYCFSRASRLLKPSEFQAVFDARKACRGKWLTVHRADAPDEATTETPEQIEVAIKGSRLGLIVAKRLVPTAARRNLIRRILRDYFRTTRDAFPHGDWIIRLHESPFPSSAGLRKGAPRPTRLQIVGGLRADLAQILKRIVQQRQKTGTPNGA